MKCKWLPCIVIATGASLSGIACAAGSTGATNPKAVIAAREALMKQIEVLMQPIDTITVEPVTDVQRLHANAEVIGAMLLAVPHLFPPTTNLYDPKVQEPETLALPTIWREFPSFYALAGAAAKAAETMATAKGAGPLRDASRKLRASCDACHALFLRKYEGPKTQDSDAQFDFDAAIGGKPADRK